MTIDEEIDERYADWMLRKAIPNGECLECHLNPNALKYPHIAGNENAHRFIFRVKKGPIGRLWVLHSCDNMRCIKLGHLFLGTASDNQQDCIRKGRATYLKGRPYTLSEEQELRVVEMRKEGKSIREISAHFNAGTRTISRIFSRRREDANSI